MKIKEHLVEEMSKYIIVDSLNEKSKMGWEVISVVPALGDGRIYLVTMSRDITLSNIE